MARSRRGWLHNSAGIGAVNAGGGYRIQEGAVAEAAMSVNRKYGAVPLFIRSIYRGCFAARGKVRPQRGFGSFDRQPPPGTKARIVSWHLQRQREIRL